MDEVEPQCEELPYDEEPKPKRRSAFSHAFSGLTLLVCMGVGMWQADQIGWTNWSEWWRRTRLHFVGTEAFREQVKPGLTQRWVHDRVGQGTELPLPEHSLAEDYPQYKSRVVYRFVKHFYYGAWVVERVEDLP